MTRRIIRSLALTSGLTFTGMALAAPLTYTLPDETAALKPGSGSEVAQNSCLTCHSADYITSQPPKKGRPFWDAEVQKMIKAYGASIGDKEAKEITDYLNEAY